MCTRLGNRTRDSGVTQRVERGFLLAQSLLQRARLLAVFRLSFSISALGVTRFGIAALAVRGTTSRLCRSLALSPPLQRTLGRRHEVRGRLGLRGD